MGVDRRGCGEAMRRRLGAQIPLNVLILVKVVLVVVMSRTAATAAGVAKESLLDEPVHSAHIGRAQEARVLLKLGHGTHQGS